MSQPWLKAFNNVPTILEGFFVCLSCFLFLNHGLPRRGPCPPHSSLPWILPAWPSFFPWTCPVYSRRRDFALPFSLPRNGPSPDLQSDGLFCLSILTSKNNLSEVFPDLSKATPHLIRTSLLDSCDFLKCSYFLIYYLSYSTGSFYEGITVSLAPTTVHTVDAQ